MNFSIFGAILRKDVRSLYPLVLLATLLFAGDVFLMRLELIPVWSIFRFPVLLLAGTVLIFAIFQADAPVSQVDDWLCRPVPRAELLTAKLVLLLAAVYLSRALATLVIDPALGTSLAESLQKAFLLQDQLAVLLLPILMFTALVTRTIVQGFVVLIAIFVAVFAIPTPFVGTPGPLEPAIGDTLIFSGLGWLSVTPATLVPICLFAPGCWLMYWRRNALAARVLLGVTVSLTMLMVLAPMWLVPWKAVYAVQTTLAAPATAADGQTIYLRNSKACFPATRVRDLATEPAFTVARQSASVQDWTGEDQRDAGPDSIVFLTSMDPRRLPQDWRVNVAFVEAQYYTPANTSPMYSLRPTSYTADSNSGSLSHAWVLPDTAVRRLGAEPQVELRMRYYLTLLEPHDFSLPTDGRRHRVPELGYCSARLDSTGGQIKVKCFLGFEEPAQISAELAEIPATRVYGPPDFSPRWSRWPFSPGHELTIGSPRLSQKDHVTVTAWTVAGYLDKSLVLPGILGNDTRTCPLPSSAEGKHFQQAVWRDTAKHEASSITVQDGVQLEVLDFGGSGPPVVLLPGLGATAHSYDELAPLLAQKHRVIAITRRGTGYSGKPDYGFDTPRLAQDVLQVMDALHLEQVLLVGHSIAGDELTWLGGHHPERFNGLVYLDAAYDRSGESGNSRLRELNRSLPPEPPLPQEALRNYQAMSKLLAERGHLPLPEGELIAFRNADKPFIAGAPSIDSRTQQAISAAIVAPDYAAVKIPALAVYAFEDPNKPLPPWYDANDVALKATLAEIARINNDARRRNIELFRRGVARGEVLELPNATHYVIQSNPREVLEAIEKFSAGLAGTSGPGSATHL